jgi:hypothetical protein
MRLVLLTIAQWLNENQGVLSVLLFLATIFVAWITGIFSALRRKPKLRLGLIGGPNLCTTFETKEKKGKYDIHRTAISLYLSVTNVGSAATSIDNVKIGYHWNVRPFSWVWFRYRIFWFWLEYPVVSIHDFHVSLGDGGDKYYPFLLQRSILSGETAESYLRVGQSTKGVIYFEQTESWGRCYPMPMSGRTKIRVAVIDSFGNKHKKTFWIPVVTLDEAKKFNPSFGETLPDSRKARVEAQETTEHGL